MIEASKTERVKYNDKLYKLCREGSEGVLFSDNPITMDMVNVINKSVIQDYNQKIPFEFRHPESGRLFVRHYKLEPRENFAIIHVGEADDEGMADYASVCINLSNERYLPYVVICDYDKLFEDHHLAAEMVESVFNWAFRGKKDKVKFVEWNVDEEDKKVIWALDCIEAFRGGKRINRVTPLMKVGHENLKTVLTKLAKSAKRIVKPLKSDNMKDYIAETFTGNKDALISEISDIIKDYTVPLLIMRPLCYCVSHGLINKDIPPKAFFHQFPEMKKYMVRQSFNRILGDRDHYYHETDALTKEMAKRFAPFM